MIKINGYGAVSIIVGILLSIYGMVHNNSIEAQLRNGASDFLNGVTGKEIIEADNSGTVCIVMGIILIIVGLIMQMDKLKTYYSENKGNEQKIDYKDENDCEKNSKNENYHKEYINNY